MCTGIYRKSTETYFILAHVPGATAKSQTQGNLSASCNFLAYFIPSADDFYERNPSLKTVGMTDNSNSADELAGAKALLKETNVSEAIKILIRIQKAFTKRLDRKNPLSSIPWKQSTFTRSAALCVWTLRHKEWNLTKGAAINASDLLFHCVCLDHIARDPVRFSDIRERLHHELNLQTLLQQLKHFACKWISGTAALEDMMQLFDECAAVIVFGYIHRRRAYMLKSAAAKFVYHEDRFRVRPAEEDNTPESKTPTAMDTGEGSGETEEEKRKYEENERRTRTENACLNLVNDFPPWCARIFFRLFFEHLLVRQVCLKPSVPVPYPRDAKESLNIVREWLNERTSYETTTAFENLFMLVAYRWINLPGALEFARRHPMSESANLDSRALFHEDSDSESDKQAMHKTLSGGVREIAKKPEHPLFAPLVLIMVSYHLGNETTSEQGCVDLMRYYVVMEDDLLESHVDLRIQREELAARAKTTAELKVEQALAPAFMSDTWRCKPRRPFFVRSAGVIHVMYKQVMHPCEHIAQAFCIWMRIMRRDFKGVMEDDRVIPEEWLTRFG